MGIFTKTRLGGVRRIVSSQSRHDSNRHTRRLPLLILVALLSSFSFSAWAQTSVTFTAGTDTYGSSAGSWSITKDAITISSSGGMGYKNPYRVYSGNTFTVSVANYTITKIVFENTTKDNPLTKLSLKSGESGNYTSSSATDSSTGTWEGSATSVKFSATAQVRMSTITVTYTDGGEVTKKFAFSSESATARIGEDFTAPTLTNEYETSVTYSSSDESVATVAADGTVTLVAEGTTTITATLDADNTVTASYTLKVNAPLSAGSDEITYSTLGLTTNTRYKNVSYTSETTGTVYSGIAAYDTQLNNAIILRAEQNSGLVAYNAALTLVAIKVDWNTTSSTDRSLVIYGKTDEAYSSSADLYSTTTTTKGTYLGEIAYSTSTAVFDLSETDNIGKYHAVGVLSSKNTIYIDKITFVWSDGTTSNAFIDIKAKKADNHYYGTYYDEKAYTIDADGVVGYAIPSSALVNGGVLVDACTVSYKKGDVVPAKTALLYWSQVAGSYPITYTESDATAPADNLLHGDDMSALGSGYKFYKLAYADANLTDLGFYFGAADGAAFTLTNAHHAFLAVPESSAAKAFVIGGNVTAIDGVEPSVAADDAPVYSLSGVRMNGGNLPKGIYIKGGKKFVKK